MSVAALPPPLGAAHYPIPEIVCAHAISPALLVYLDHVRHNIETVVVSCGSPARWRPHLKTSKIPEVWSLLLDAGVRRFKCATTREAAVFLDLVATLGLGDADLLIAYPLVGPGLIRAGQLAAEHPATRVAVLSDDPAHAAGVPAPLGVFIDVDAGMHRTGSPAEDGARLLAIARAAGPRVRGLHGYEGHLRDPDRNTRRDRTRAAHERVAAAARGLIDAGHAMPEVITTGTPTLPDVLAGSPLAGLAGTEHTVSAGTAVFGDLTSLALVPELPLRPAAAVLARVVSRPTADGATCDAGSKAITVDAGHPCCAVVGWPNLEPLVPTEEHLPLRILEPPAPPRGEPVVLIPRHVCPTVNLADEAILIDGETIQRVPVAGRGHEIWVEGLKG